MEVRERRTQLRGAVARRDSSALVEILRTQPWLEHALQMIGDGLTIALADGVDGARDLADRCVAELRTRGWDGDEELADRLESLLGSTPTRLLRPLPVDLEELSMVLEGDPVEGGGRIDLRTGEVWPRPAIDYMEEIGEDDDPDDPDRWLWVQTEGSRAGYRDMELFIGELEDPDAADRLSIAIIGRGAFRRFKDVLARWPELGERWYGFHDERQRGRARAWLAGEGYGAMI